MKYQGRMTWVLLVLSFMLAAGFQLPYPPCINVPNVKLQLEGSIQDGKIQHGAIADAHKFIEKAYDTSFLNDYFGKKGK